MPNCKLSASPSHGRPRLIPISTIRKPAHRGCFSLADCTHHIFHEDSPDKLTAIETVKTEFGAKTMGLDSKTHRLFVDTSDFLRRILLRKALLPSS